MAIVGNNLVLHSDVLQQSQIIASSRGVDYTKKPYLFEEIYVDVLENMVDQYAILDIAEKDTNIIISDEEVDRALDLRINEFISQAGSKELFEEMVGLSLRQIKSEYWLEIRNMMMIERYKYSKIQGVDVSRIEVNNFYSIYKDSIPAISKQYDFSVIEVPFVSGIASENKVFAFIDSLRSFVVDGGASFDSLAILYSQDSGSSFSGGKLGFTSRGSLVLAYEEAAYSLNPGEISGPVRSKFGYHVIRLIDKIGEKISTQHILRFVPVSDKDKGDALKEAQSIFNYTENDPFVFDSVSIEYENLYKNFSGTYTGLAPPDIPSFILNNLHNQLQYKLSLPIESENGYVLIYLYEYKKEYLPSPDNAWALIYQYALQEKQSRTFQNLVYKIKDKTFIKIF